LRHRELEKMEPDACRDGKAGPERGQGGTSRIWSKPSHEGDDSGGWLGYPPCPLTDDRPKALVEVAGYTLLEITLRRLRQFGVREVIVNVHHFADLVVGYLKNNDNFGMCIEISREEVLLDTGGSLKKAAWFFLEDSSHPDEPFVLHNVDVLSTIDLDRMAQFHRQNQRWPRWRLQDRETSRYLMFDEQNQLCGRRAGATGRLKLFVRHWELMRWHFPACT